MSVMRTLEIRGRARTIFGEPDDSYFGHFARVGVYSDDVTSFLDATIRPGWLCFDVGANIGLTSIYMCATKPGVRVVAFEPSPTTFALLRQNIATNELEGTVSAVQVAITDHRGSAAFVELGTSLSGSHILDTAVRHPHAVGLTPIEVPCTTLDEYLHANPVERLDLLKVDVEGHEEQVLHGARETLRRYRPVTVVEFNGWFLRVLQNDQRHQLLDVLFAIFDSVSVISKTSAESDPLQNDSASRERFLDANWAGGGVDNLLCRFL